MNPKNLKFLSSRESIPSDISMLDNFDIDHLKRYWKVFKTSSNVLPGGHRLENLFWRMWGSEKLHKTLSGSRIAILFMMIQQGEEAFEKTPRLRIPEFGKAVHSRIQSTPRLPPRASLIPPTPPPSPIEPQFTGPGGRPPMSRLPSQGDIAESLYQAVRQLRQIPVRSSPPNPPPPSPATPMASPLLAAVQAKSGQTEYFTGSERPGVASGHSDNTMMNVNSAAIAPPRNPPRPSNITRKSSNSTLPVVEEVVSTAPPTTQQRGPKRSESSVSIAESMTSSASTKDGKKVGTGSKPPKKGTLPKGKAKFSAGKKGGLRPALVRQKSSASSTVVENEEEGYEGEGDELTEVKAQIAMQNKPLVEDLVNIKDKGPMVDEMKPVGGLSNSMAGSNKTVEEVKKPVTEKPPAHKRLVLEVVSDIAEDGDDFEDEEGPKVAPPPMRRTISAGPTLGGKKNKKGPSARLSKKNRNASANAGRAAPGLGIAAALGGPGTGKDAEEPAPLPVVSIVEPDFRRKFQERNNITRAAPEDGISVPSGNSSPGSSVSTVESNGKGKRREKLMFLTSDKSHPTVSIAASTSSVVVAKKMHGQNVLMVESGEIRGLNSQRTPMATRRLEIEDLNGVSMGGSGGGGSGKSALSLMIEDAKRKNGGKVGSGEKGSLGGS